MGLVSKSIPNLINGVSQQPAALRLDSQGEVQENGFSDVVDGLKKRPPTKFLKKLVKINADWDEDNTHLYSVNDEGDKEYIYVDSMGEHELAHAFFHTYKRSDNVQFQVVITPDKVVRVYDIEGNLRYESGVGSWLADGTFLSANEDDTSYLPDHYADITATSVADATFIVNKNKKVEMLDFIEHPKVNDEALVYLKSVNYGRGYKVTIDRETSSDLYAQETAPQSVTAPADGTTENNESDLKVSNIIGALRNQLYSGAAYTHSFEQESIFESATQSSLTSYVYNEEWDAIRTVDISDLINPPSGADQAEEYLGNDETKLQVLTSRLFSYDATGNNGWKWKDDAKTKIFLPESAIVTQQSYNNSSRRWHTYFIRPALSIMRIANTGANGIAVQPQTYNDEPFFVLSSAEPFEVAVSDDDGGVNLKAFKGTAKSFTDLPNQCIPDTRLGVVGDNQKKEDDFHVVFEGRAGQGFWRETTGYDQYNEFDLTTMPHSLNQEDDGSFYFGHAKDNENNTWAKRKAGDDNTNPTPSFVGGTITDIFFHRNRLGVLSGENVIFSEAGGYLNFWRTTVRTLLDSDPIDVSVSQNEVAELKAAVPIQDNLLLFSELNQFTLSASQLLTPAEVTIDQSTKYECDLTATPVGAGTSVFFATKSGDFSGVREFFTKDDTEAKDAPEITTHVPKYIAGRITDIKSSSNEDILVALTDADKSECYVYKWYNSAQERLQSSWSKWKFSKNIASIFFNNSDLFFTFEDGSYEKLDLAQVTNPVFLDHQIEITNNLQGAELDKVNSYPYTGNNITITEEGYNLGVYAADNPDIVAYLATGKKLTVGEPYTFKYQLSEQVFKRGEDVINLARFQLRKINFNFSNAGKFDVTVESLGRDPSTKTFTGRILGEPENILGQAAIVPEGTFQVGIQSNPKTTKITITNDTHLPCVFQSAEWEGFVVLRNQRL